MPIPVCAHGDYAAFAAVRAARVDAIVRRVMAGDGIPGIAIGIARDGVTVYARGYGYRDARRRMQACDTTMFPIGSLTKSFTAALVRMRLQPDAPLARYVPDYPNAKDITIDELLRDTAGIPDFADAPGFDRASIAAVTPERLVAQTAAMPAAFAPGSATAYSNGDYLLAAYALQRSGVPVARAMRDACFAPLGMRRTVVSGTIGFGTADVDSTAGDMLAWYGALEAGDRFPRPRYLPPYADGFFDGAMFGRRALWAAGYVAGYSSYGAILPDDRTAVVVLADADAVTLAPLAQSLVAIALDIREDAPH